MTKCGFSLFQKENKKLAVWNSVKWQDLTLYWTLQREMTCFSIMPCMNARKFQVKDQKGVKKLLIGHGFADGICTSDREYRSPCHDLAGPNS